MISLFKKNLNPTIQLISKTLLLAFIIFALMYSSITNAQEKDKTVNAGGGATPVQTAELIEKFTKNESMLRDKWNEYSYLRESRFQVLGHYNTIVGEYYVESEYVLNDAGNRIERVLKSPQPTLTRAGLGIAQDDKNPYINPQPFVLTTEDKPDYDITYVGKEKLDELDVYVFDVVPKVMNNEKELKKLKRDHIEGKFFQGRVYVDDQDLQIVKTTGKLVPEFKQRFPKYESYRENVDKNYWLPTYVFSDDVLEFERRSIHIVMMIKYKNYKRIKPEIK